jgi:centriolar protein POC1
VRLWDVHQNTCIHVYDDHFAAVNAVAFHPDGTCVASGGADAVVQLWDVRSKKLAQHYQVP